MASEFCKKYLIVSRPSYDFNVWVPYVLISWRKHGELQFQKFPELKKFTFSTEEEARSFGFSTAHSWLDARTQWDLTAAADDVIPNPGPLARA